MVTPAGLLEELELERIAADELELEARRLRTTAGEYRSYARRAALDVGRQARAARAHVAELENRLSRHLTTAGRSSIF